MDNLREWFINSDATCHVAWDRNIFTSYTCVEGRKVHVANTIVLDLVKTKNVAMEFTNGKVLTLKDELHVPNIRKNLESGSLLVRNRLSSCLNVWKVCPF